MPITPTTPGAAPPLSEAELRRIRPSRLSHARIPPPSAAEAARHRSDVDKRTDQILSAVSNRAGKQPADTVDFGRGQWPLPPPRVMRRYEKAQEKASAAMAEFEAAKANPVRAARTQATHIFLRSKPCAKQN